MDSPLKYFAELRDPRVERTREHLLEEILLMAIAAILSGANGWNEIEAYARARHEWLKSFLSLPGSIPSHDTFNRVFAALDPEELGRGFVAWVASIARLTAGEVVAIDGKTLRGSAEPGKKAIVPMVSSWAEGNGLVLGQRKVDEKSNEITAIPKLLEALALRGTVVTLDAMGFQRAIAEKIVAQGADYSSGGQRKPGRSAGRDQGFVSDAGRRRGCRRDRLRPRPCRTAEMCGDRRPVAARKGRCMAVVVGPGAHPGRTLSQGHGKHRARNPRPHHQSPARSRAAKPGHPSALGH